MIEVINLQKRFPVKEGFLRTLISNLRGQNMVVNAVNGISFTMTRGEIVGLAGESGCGKTTTGMCLSGCIHPLKEAFSSKERM